MTADNEPLDLIGMLYLAKAQYEETLIAVHAALDETLGRDHRTRDDSAAASIRRLAVEAERRRVVKALRGEAERLPALGLGGDGTAAHALFDLARRIESGEVTLP